MTNCQRLAPWSCIILIVACSSIACRQSSTPTDEDATGVSLPPTSRITPDDTPVEKGEPDPADLSDPPPPPPAVAITWEIDLPHGTHSSPRIINVNGYPELLIAYGHERSHSGGAMVIDIETGHSRWSISAGNELFSLPVPLTQREGAAPWVFGGREGHLYAVDALSGAELWQFQPSGEASRADGIFNFYAGLEIGDVGGDAAVDYLVANGGDYAAGRTDERPPGHLLVLSGSDGSIIHRIEVPDGRETYFSPVMWKRSGESLVVFGTGGETFPGSLWTVPVESLRKGNLENVQRVIRNVVDKGMVAPPAFADVDADGETDLIAAPYDGRLIVLSGKTMQPLWEFKPEEVSETQASPAIGDFDGDGDLDIAHSVQLGVFPQWKASEIRAFDGASGELLWEHRTTEDVTGASPLAVDIDADGKDEVTFIHANPALFNSYSSYSDNPRKCFSILQIVHVDEKRMEALSGLLGFNAGTGLITDADQDGKLEWFVPLNREDETGGLARLDLETPVPNPIAWGGYLGTHHDSTYRAAENPESDDQ